MPILVSHSPINLQLPLADRQDIIPLQSHNFGSNQTASFLPRLPAISAPQSSKTPRRLDSPGPWHVLLLRVITLRNFDPRNLVNNVLRVVCDENGSGSDIVSRNHLRPKISYPNRSRFVNPQSVLIAFYVLISRGFGELYRLFIY